MENLINSQTQCIIFKSLYENYCCMRCILRMLKIDTLNLYRDTTQYKQILNQIGDKLGNQFDQNYCEKNFINGSQNFCRVCLGIMQQADKDHLINEICDQIRKQDFEFNLFKFNVKMPQSTMLRYYHILCFTQLNISSMENLDQYELNRIFDDWKNSLIELKTVYKWVASPLVAQNLNAKPDNSDTFCINISFQDDKDDQLQFEPFISIIRNQKEILNNGNPKKKVKLNQNCDEQTCTGCNLHSKILLSHNNIEQITKLNCSQFLQIRNMKNADIVQQQPNLEQYEKCLTYEQAYLYIYSLKTKNFI